MTMTADLCCGRWGMNKSGLLVTLLPSDNRWEWVGERSFGLYCGFVD